MAGTAIFLIWENMRRRCADPRNKRFSDYGGRGIAVCARWQSFDNFYADMGDRPSGTTLDRKNNDGDYEPGNCRWATVHQQQGNKRTTIYLEYGGRCMGLAAWARTTKIRRATLYARVRRGWPAALALNMPMTPHGKRIIKAGAQTSSA